jgi:hypothetical protein
VYFTRVHRVASLCNVNQRYVFGFQIASFQIATETEHADDPKVTEGLTESVPMLRELRQIVDLKVSTRTLVSQGSNQSLD